MGKCIFVCSHFLFLEFFNRCFSCSCLSCRVLVWCEYDLFASIESAKGNMFSSIWSEQQKIVIKKYFSQSFFKIKEKIKVKTYSRIIFKNQNVIFKK